MSVLAESTFFTPQAQLAAGGQLERLRAAPVELGQIDSALSGDHGRAELVEQVVVGRGAACPVGADALEQPQPLQLEQPFAGTVVAFEVELAQLADGQHALLVEGFADRAVAVGEAREVSW